MMKNRNIKNVVSFGLMIAMLAGCLYFVYFVPKAKYKSAGITSEIMDSIPMNAGAWRGTDVKIGKDDFGDGVYNFLSRVFARYYSRITDTDENGAFLIVLDAGNFHYPKVCFQGAGYNSKELPQKDLSLGDRKLNVHVMLSEKKDEKLLSIYWICIDKKIVPSWAEQKIKQLCYSLFNKERVGLMVRVDMDVNESVETSIETCETFLNNLYRSFPDEYREYIFGS
jgi:EpsI family protein